VEAIHIIPISVIVNSIVWLFTTDAESRIIRTLCHPNRPYCHAA
jgi:hypothetical protein